MKIVDNETYLNQREVADFLGLSARHFNRLVINGVYKLPHPLRIGKRDYYKQSQLKPYNRKRRPNA